MKYKEPQILLEVRKIKEQLHEKMKAEGAEAFFERINQRASKYTVGRKLKVPKKS